MTIIASTDLSDYGSKVNKSITLQEQFGLYMIILVEYRPGWLFGYQDVSVLDTSIKYRDAVDCYIKNGGVMRREF